MLKQAKQSGNIIKKIVSTNASSFPCQLPDFGGLKLTFKNKKFKRKSLPSIEMVTPS